MGNLKLAGFFGDPPGLNDAGGEMDENGIPVDAKAKLKEILVDNFSVTKGHYLNMNAEQKARFSELTSIDEQDMVNDNDEAGRTCVDSL